MKNREPKFRAFITVLGVMTYDVDVYANGSIGVSNKNLTDAFYKLYHINHDCSSIVTNGTYAHMLTIDTGDECVWFDENQYELMQYIGLKDKNRTEIYAGSIISGIRKGSNSDRSHTGFIEWNTQQAGWIIRCGKHIIEILSLAMDGDGIETRLSAFEVIGNIHQHPDLLK